MDRFNRPLPAAITRTCMQIRDETLLLYYQYNTFECWRPIPGTDWQFSTLTCWLRTLGSTKIAWLRDLVLLYKQEEELEHDIETGLADYGIELRPGAISNKRELSEFEMSYEQLGLPRHFGQRGRRNRWVAGNASNA